MGIGSVWGTREELLHPRDRRGRFRKKWKMAEGVANKILGFLDTFSPRLFQNDAQAAQYTFNSSKTPWNRGELTRLHMDYDEANEHLRTGDMDESTKAFVEMMERHKVPARDDIILSRTVGPEAFGLTAEQMGAEDGGIEDFTGKLIADRAYGAAHIGGILGGQAPGPGKVTMRIAVPKGTPLIVPARNRDDRGLFLDRDQELRITKVQPDGAGGYYMLAVATPRTKGDTPEPVSTSPRGVGLTPEQREARIAQVEHMPLPSLRREEEAAQERIAQAEAAEPIDAARRAQRLEDLRLRQVEQPQEPPQTTDQLPQGVEPRNEPVITPGQGQAPPTPVAEPSTGVGVPTPDQFRAAVREAALPSPSAGPRRLQWNEAYLGIANGKKDPADALRELETDIRVNRETRVSSDDPNLLSDIKAQEQLANLIREQYGLGRREEAPVPTPTPEPEAPAPVKKATRAKKAVSSEGGTKAAGLTPEQRESVRNRVSRMKSEGKFNPDNPEHQRLQSLVDQMGAGKKAAPKTAKAPAAKKAAPAKAPTAKTAPAKAAAKKAVPEKATGPAPITRSNPMVDGERVQWTDPQDGKTIQGTVSKAGPNKGLYVNWDTGRRERFTGLRRPEDQGIVRVSGTAKKAESKPEAPAPIKAAKKAPSLAAQRRERARAELRDQGIENPSATVLDEHVRNMVEQEQRDLIRSRSGGVAGKKAAPTPEAPERAPLEKQTVLGLRRTAELEGVELRSKMLKADIIKEIQRARTNRSAPRTPTTAEDVITPADEELLRQRESVQAPPVTPEAAKAVARVPEGSVPGPRAQVPVSTPERRAGFTEAWRQAGIPNPPGSAGRSMREIRDDVSSGKITPEEGVRRMESEIALNKDELADIDATLRGDLPPEERRKLIGQADDLERAIGAQEKASTFMRDHFKAEAPVSGKKEILRLEVPAEVKEALDKATPEDLKEAAKREGFGDVKGDTVDEVIQDFAKKVAEKELADRATKAAKKAAPKKAPAKAAAPKIDRERIDATILAQGLGIEEWDTAPSPGQTKYLDDVQDALDGKRVAELPPNSSPAAIGRWLQKRADMVRTSTAIRFGGVRQGDTRDPEAQRQVDQMYKRADSLSELAKRLQATRRVAKKTAPVKKVAPEVKAAEARADTAETRILQNAVDLLQDVKTEGGVRGALANLTFPEIREIGRQHGVTGRSKESIIKGLVDRYTKPSPAPAAESKGLAQILDEMGSFENPASREAVAEAIKGFKKADLLAEAKRRNLPRAGTLTTAELRAELVEASVGRRLDSIATRGFREERPMMPREVEADVLRTQASTVDESVPLGNMYRGDNMRYHNDSPTMEVAHAYAAAGRNGSANRMVDLRGRSTAREGRIHPEETVKELRRIRAEETDPRFQRMLDDAIERIGAPERPLPDLPADTPPVAREFIENLQRIPYARKVDREPISSGYLNSHGRGSIVEQVAAVFRDAAAQRRDESRRSPEDRIRKILRDQTHESNEASFELFDLSDRPFERVPDPTKQGKMMLSPISQALRDWERGQLPSQTSTSWRSVRDKVDNLSIPTPGEVGSLVADLPTEELRAWADSIGIPKTVTTKPGLINALVGHYGESFEGDNEE